MQMDIIKFLRSQNKGQLRFLTFKKVAIIEKADQCAHTPLKYFF